MPDPVLNAHQLGPRFYSIGGKLFPIGIRDQMVRAQLFVSRAYNRGLIGLETKPLVIVGAGAAGVCAALTACSKNVPTFLVERLGDPLTVQANCQTRFIDPGQYDFPSSHWTSSSYPPNQPVHAAMDVPLAWDSNWAHLLAIAWRKKMDEVLANSKLLTWLPHSTLDDSSPPKLDASGDHVEAIIQRNDPATQAPSTLPISAAAVLLAVGFGKEKRYLRPPGQPPHPTWGYGFWEDDPFPKPNFGVEPNQPPEILISGSGDGALQDFLRVTTTCDSAREIYSYVNLPDMLLHRLLDAEESARRCISWGVEPRHNHTALQHLHHVYAGVVEEHARRNRARVERGLNKVLRRPAPTVQFLYECDHFSNCYGLNRFLALLIAAHLEKRRGKGTVLMSGRRLKDLTSADGHICQRNPARCHGQAHTVTWVGCPDCRSGPTGPTGSLSANVLILRHGIDVADLRWDPTPPQFWQMVPYFIPR